MTQMLQVTSQLRSNSKTHFDMLILKSNLILNIFDMLPIFLVMSHMIVDILICISYIIIKVTLL